MTSGQGRRAVVIEVNEVPLNVLWNFAAYYPASNIARLLAASRTLTTVADDMPPEFLFPARTWASMNSGVPYDTHQIKWFNDRKPPEYPFYWKLLANSGRSVGLVNTPHVQSPEELVKNPQIAFLIPDVFQPTSVTKPSKYSGFQAFQQQRTQSNRRDASLSNGILPPLNVLLSLSWLGLSLRSAFRIGSTVAGVATRLVTKERLRNIQFLLVADMFNRLLRKNDVDLAVFFTNHVAANMHRHWGEELSEKHNHNAHNADEARRQQGEIAHALKLLDPLIGKMMTLCQNTGRTLILNSSMGQHADPDLDTISSERHLIEDLEKFLSIMGVEGPYRRMTEMAPSYRLEFESAEKAENAFRTLDTKQINTVAGWLDLNDRHLVMTMRYDWFEAYKKTTSKPLSPADLALKAVPKEHRHGGYHHPDGSLVIYNGSVNGYGDETRFNYLEFAPSILDFFGVPVPDYMVKPSLRL